MLESQGKLKLFEDEQVIFKEGSYGDEMFVVDSGNVEIYRVRNNHELRLARLGPKEFFGELSFFGNYPRSASAKAVGLTKVYVIDKNAFLKLVNDNVVWSILKKLGDRIRLNDDKIEKLMISDQVRKEALQTVIQRRSWT